MHLFLNNHLKNRSLMLRHLWVNAITCNCCNLIVISNSHLFFRSLIKVPHKVVPSNQNNRYVVMTLIFHLISYTVIVYIDSQDHYVYIERVSAFNTTSKTKHNCNTRGKTSVSCNIFDTWNVNSMLKFILTILIEMYIQGSG